MKQYYYAGHKLRPIPNLGRNVWRYFARNGGEGFAKFAFVALALTIAYGIYIGRI